MTTSGDSYVRVTRRSTNSGVEKRQFCTTSLGEKSGPIPPRRQETAIPLHPSSNTFRPLFYHVLMTRRGPTIVVRHRLGRVLKMNGRVGRRSPRPLERKRFGSPVQIAACHVICGTDLESLHSRNAGPLDQVRLFISNCPTIPTGTRRNAGGP